MRISTRSPIENPVRERNEPLVRNRVQTLTTLTRCLSSLVTVQALLLFKENYSGKLSLVNDTHLTLNNHFGARTYKVTINAEKNPRYVDENRTDHNDVVHSRA